MNVTTISKVICDIRYIVACELRLGSTDSTTVKLLVSINEIDTKWLNASKELRITLMSNFTKYLNKLEPVKGKEYKTVIMRLASMIKLKQELLN